jgi:D-tagatose-1,6-bisphosphate aldolase subunit GatZ/KbaZ
MAMLLDTVIQAQKSGKKLGITSICSSHPSVIKAALRGNDDVLIEATCNQVNQYGGYSGLKPRNFIEYVEKIAIALNFPKERIIFGGDHLGPNVWKNETALSAMSKSKVLISDYVKAGFRKIHVDCSMQLGDDPGRVLSPEIAAQRSAELIAVAEGAANSIIHKPWYVIGTEVPVPGGHQSQDEQIHVSSVGDVHNMIDLMKKSLYSKGLEEAWERVVAAVVQPGVDFGNDFIIPYDPKLAINLKTFITTQPFVYEAHSTDYQSVEALTRLVEDHFAILKVGPALTFAFREAVFTLAKIEDYIVPKVRRSNLMNVIDEVMVADPKYWKGYYCGEPDQVAEARINSYSDRIRYYWNYLPVQEAFSRLMENMTDPVFDSSLNSIPGYVSPNDISSNEKKLTPQVFITDKITSILEKYKKACGILN